MPTYGRVRSYPYTYTYFDLGSRTRTHFLSLRLSISHGNSILISNTPPTSHSFQQNPPRPPKPNKSRLYIIPKMEPLLTPYPIISLLSTHITQDDLINLSLTSQSAHYNLFTASRAHWKNLYSKTAPPASCTFTASKTGYHRFSVALKELQVGRCVRCFTAVCKVWFPFLPSILTSSNGFADS